MSSQTLARPKRSEPVTGKEKKRLRLGGLVAATGGIAITFAAVKMAEILPLMGAGGLLRLQFLYPYALLLKQPQLGLSEPTSNSGRRSCCMRNGPSTASTPCGDEVEAAVGGAHAGRGDPSIGLRRTVATGARLGARRKAKVATERSRSSSARGMPGRRCRSTFLLRSRPITCAPFPHRFSAY